MQPSSPSIAANIGYNFNSSYPSPNQQLYTNSEYNFTAGLRDDAVFNRVYDSVNRVVQQSDQVAYSNTSIQNLGTFNATYSFTDDRAGGLAAGFSYGVATYTVLDSQLGHRKVLKIDGTGSAWSAAITSFTAITDTTVNTSFWLCTPTAFRAGEDFGFFPRDGAMIGPYVSVYTSGMLAYFVGGVGWTNVLQLVVNRWYYITISARVDTDRFDLFVDGAKLANNAQFANGLGDVDNIYLNVYDKEFYVDAIDIEHYDPGCYSTSTGVFRNSIDLGQVGIYNATYSFENETMFAVPGGFDVTAGTGCSAVTFPQVATGTYGHHNVLCLNDQNNPGQVFVNRSYSSPQTSGTVEMWFLTNDVTNLGYLLDGYLANTGLYGPHLYILSGSLYVGGSIAMPVAINTWYHIRVGFDCTTFKYSVWVNGMLRASSVAFSTNIASIGLWCTHTETTVTGYQLYIDAFDLTTDAQYSPERNSWMFLNSTQQFTVPGAYSSKWQAWSSGVAYDAPITPFTVIENVQLINSASYATELQFTDMATTPIWSGEYLSDFGTEIYTLTASSGIYYIITGSENPIYTANFSTDAWTGGSTFNKNVSVPDDTYVEEDTAMYLPTFGNEPLLKVRTYASPAVTYSFLCWEDVAGYYHDANVQQYLNIYSNDADFVGIHKSTQFDEYYITWNNQPPDNGHINDFAVTPASWNQFDLGTGVDTNSIRLDYPYYGSQKNFDSSESSHVPQITQQFSQVLRLGSILYLQSGNSTSITASSPVTGDIAVNVGDYAKLSYTTNASNLQVTFLDSGVVQDSYSLAAQIQFDSAFTFDQIQVNGSFDEREKIAISSLQVYHASNKLAQTTTEVLIRTDVSETLTLRSPATFAFAVATNYRIILDYNTTTTRELKLNLKSAGVTQQSYTVVTEGGTQFSTFSIIATCNFDQFEFSGIVDTNTFTLGSIALESAVYTSPIYNFFLSAYSDQFHSLPNGSYLVEVFPCPRTGVTLQSNIRDLITNQLNVISYTPQSGQERQINLYDNNSQLVQFTDFRVVVNRTLNGLTQPVNMLFPHYLLSNRFWADGGSYYNCTIYDKFGNVLYNVTNAAIANFIDITLSIYTFKIQNRMREDTLVTINNTLSKPLVSGEVLETNLKSGSYTIVYDQSELGVCINETIAIVGPTLYILNSSYHSIYFSCFSNDGMGVATDTVRLYLNGTRKAWGPVDVLGVANISAVDYIGDVQYSAIVDLSLAPEFNVFVNIATVITNNLDNENPLAICIWKGGILLQNQTIGAQSSLSFRFTNGHYNLGAFYTNGTSFGANQSVDVLASGTDLKTYTLTWGTYHPDLPQEIPTPGFPELLMLIAVIAVIGLIVTWILVAHERSKRKEAERRFYEMSRRGR